ncbi:hypothetical protein P5G86_22100 [Paenibacillus jamilae]|nr:hypothetical protein [Bacillus thuringiensis]MEB4842691.1 hypothetical protein [Paenibacillus jamilae]MEB9279892.1 hypothetical protein [Bacillus cereus]MEC3036773.1 hypothetical protein [Bacillus cereus]
MSVVKGSVDLAAVLSLDYFFISLFKKIMINWKLELLEDVLYF